LRRLLSAVVFIDRLEPADSRRDALIGPPLDFAESINADPECLKYSVHEPIDGEAAPFAIIQAYESVAVVTCHCRSLRCPR